MKVEKTFTKEKETKNKVRFKEEIEPGTPPSLETVYLPKYLVGSAQQVKITIEIDDQ